MKVNINRVKQFLNERYGKELPEVSIVPCMLKENCAGKYCNNKIYINKLNTNALDVEMTLVHEYTHHAQSHGFYFITNDKEIINKLEAAVTKMIELAKEYKTEADRRSLYSTNPREIDSTLAELCYLWSIEGYSVEEKRMYLLKNKFRYVSHIAEQMIVWLSERVYEEVGIDGTMYGHTPTSLFNVIADMKN